MLLLTNYFYSQITPSVYLVKPINCVSNAEINITASGGQLPYEYSINKEPYQISNTFKNLTAGYYVIAVKDALNSVNYAYIALEDPQVLSMTATATNSTNMADDSGKITVIGTGGTEPYMYTLTNNTSLPIGSPQESNSFTGLKSGIYSVQIKDAGGCNYTKTDITIANNPNDNPFVITFEATEVNCMNPTVVLSIYVSNAVSTYQYSIDNGKTYSDSNTFGSLEPGSYNIKVRDAQNRVASIIAIIDPVSTPIVTAMANANILCKGNNTGSITVATIKGRAPYTYSLNGDDFTRKDTFTNLRAGTYSIRVKDYNNCISSTTITLTEPAEGLSATAFPVNDQSIIVNAKGGTAPYLYYLQNNMGIVIAGPQDHGIFIRLPLGYYSAQVTDASGCGLIQGPINIIPAPALSVAVDVLAVNCRDAGRITVNAIGGVEPYQYSIDNEKTYTNANGFSNLSSGTYSITVRDALNTTKSIFATIEEIKPLVVTYSKQNLLCFGDNSGSITLTASEGEAPYYYSIDGSSFVETNTFSNLQSGTYNLTAKDAYGCIQSIIITIDQPDPIIATIEVKNQTININATDGVGEITYAIFPDYPQFSTKTTFPNLLPGVYNVIARDENGCTVSTYVTIDPKAPIIDGKNEIIVAFKLGQTLADIIVDGQNIKWYSTKNSSTGRTSKTSKTTEIQLPPTTLLVDGTTYYASQTINGVESKERLAVTMKLNTLSTPDFILSNFKYHPNPVKNILTIENTSVIDEASLFSVSGKVILDKKINSLHSNLDLSNVATGIYILKVKSEGQEKTIKIVKE